MEMVTVKRNGVFISFPELITKNQEIRNDVIVGTMVITPEKKKKEEKIINPNKIRTNNTGIVQKKARSIIKCKTGRKCLRCGEACWRSDVSYCWECYKYENYESK